MTVLTKASEALLAEVDGTSMALTVYRDRLLAIEAAVRADTLADVAARLPEALHRLDICPTSIHGGECGNAAAILAHLGGTDR